MDSGSGEVKDFFSNIASGYRDKYTGRDVFSHYFFNERLEEATKDLDFNGKRILDIGAGTGNLYDHIQEKEPNIDYYATDISGAMLEQSNIPSEKRFVTQIGNIEIPVFDFDFIFVLGVTTYLDDDTLQALFSDIDRYLAHDGTAIITFTNLSSLDWKIRRLFKIFLRGGVSSKTVLTQKFQIYPRSLDTATATLSGQFVSVDIRWLNHTVFPFNRVLKNLSVKMAKKIHKKENTSKLKQLLSSDFLLVLRKL